MHYNVFQYLKVNMWGDLGLMENGMHAIFSLVFQVLQTTDVVPEDSCLLCCKAKEIGCLFRAWYMVEYVL